jgi:hypothetical protein
MFWLSTVNVSQAMEPIASDSRPWATLKKFWQFSSLYGSYQAEPPSQRRLFILELERECLKRVVNGIQS